MRSQITSSAPRRPVSVFRAAGSSGSGRYARLSRNPIAAERARENRALNRLTFEVHELALWDTNGTAAFEDGQHRQPHGCRFLALASHALGPFHCTNFSLNTQRPIQSARSRGEPKFPAPKCHLCKTRSRRPLNCGRNVSETGRKHCRVHPNPNASPLDAVWSARI